MKKELLKHILTSVVAVAGLALLFVMSQSVIAQSNGYGSSNLLQLSGFNLEKFQLAPTDIILELGDNSPLLQDLPSGVAFRNYGSSILNQTSVVNNAFFDHKAENSGDVGDLNIGFSSYDVPSIARLQVGGGSAGTVQVEDLSDANDPNIYCVCADQYGEMRRCGIFDPANGQTCSGTAQQTLYSCTGPTPTNATMCAGDNQGLTANTPNSLVGACTANKCEYTCSAGYTLEGGVCVANVEIVEETYQWVIGQWGQCSGTTGSCSGSWTVEIDTEEGPGVCGPTIQHIEDGGSSVVCSSITSQGTCNSNSTCMWYTNGGGEPEILTYSCNRPTTSAACTALNDACTWNAGAQTQTRTVTCQNSLGETVADNLCTPPAPVTSQACTAASCSGSWTTTEMQGNGPINWFGDEFNWTDGTVYEPDGTIVGYCGINNDLQVGENMNGNGGPNNTACLMVWYDLDFPAGIMYEFSVARNSWDQLTVNESGTVTNINQNYAPAYGATGEQVVVTNLCAGPTTQAACTAQNQACTWNPGS